MLASAASVFAIGPAIQINEGDFMKYEVTYMGSAPETINYTFSKHVSADTINVTVTYSNWTALGYSIPPGNQGYGIVDLTNGRVSDQSPNYLFGSPSMALFTPLLFDWFVQGDLLYAYSGIVFGITGEVNITRGHEYPCWNITGDSNYNRALYDKASGILLESESKEPGNLWTFNLIEANIDDTHIVPEFSSIWAVSVFLIVSTFLAAFNSGKRVLGERVRSY
jgi:hypothetical protein